MNESHQTRRDFLKTVGAALLGSAVLGRKSVGRSVRRPNVVFILTDDQGTLDANCFGSTDLHTPAIDKIAANGVRFTQAYAHIRSRSVLSQISVVRDGK